MEKGWQRFDGYKFREVNRVKYDPQQVGLKQLEDWLKQARTYRATIRKPPADKGDSQ